MNVVIETDDGGLLLPAATKLAEVIQVARVVVNHEHQSRHYAVLLPLNPALDPTAVEELVTELFPGYDFCQLLGGPHGQETLRLRSEDEFTIRGAAAAVATLKRSWTWDDSPTISILVPNGPSTFVVDPFFESGTWIVADVTAV
jgi:hypothetical protein